VPLDGSRFSEWSLSPAISIARRYGATLELVTVHYPIPTSVAAHIPGYDPEWESAGYERAQSYVRDIAERIAKTSGVKVKGSVRSGLVVATLLLFAKETGCDLIVLTTHGRGVLSRAWLGSVANGLVRQSQVPVLLIRPQEHGEADRTAETTFQRVLVTLDGSDLSEEILPGALAVGGPSAEYQLLEVIYPPLVLAPAYGNREPPRLDENLLRDQRALAESYLERIAEPLRKQGRRVQATVRDEPSAAVAILDHAATNAIDLIAMATHGRSGLGRLVLGSVADKVVRGASTPVLLHHPRGTGGSAAGT
jgi:nucleotide-binding universal stress UspA family protein